MSLADCTIMILIYRCLLSCIVSSGSPFGYFYELLGISIFNFFQNWPRLLHPGYLPHILGASFPLQVPWPLSHSFSPLTDAFFSQMPKLPKEDLASFQHMKM